MRLRHSLVRAALAVATLGLFSGVSAAEPIQRDFIKLCTPAICPPDLAVREEIRSVWRWDPNRGWYSVQAQGFTIYNIGVGAAGGFHVAVLRTSQSYGFDVAGLAVGASQWYEVDASCGEAVTVIVNPWNALPESNYNNNSVGFYGWCGL